VFIPTGTLMRPVFCPLTIAAGFQSKELILSADLALGDLDQYPVIDVTLDGADE
jgi:ribose 5-phosphate isomerase